MFSRVERAKILELILLGFVNSALVVEREKIEIAIITRVVVASASQQDRDYHSSQVTADRNEVALLSLVASDSRSKHTTANIFGTIILPTSKENSGRIAATAFDDRRVEGVVTPLVLS